MAAAEIVTRRRKWTPAEKAALLAEVEAEGGRVSVIARRHGISNSLIYNWRAAWKAAASMRQVEFVPLGTIGGDANNEDGPRLLTAPRVSERQEDCAGRIEIDLPGGARVRVDGSVNEKALTRVLRAVRGSM